MQWDPVIDSATALHPGIVGLLQKRLSDLRDGFRQNVALVGPPGSGKSSVLLTTLALSAAHAADSATGPQRPPFLVVYCQARREPWEAWAKRFVLATLHSVKEFRPDLLEPLDEQALLRAAYACAPRAAQTAAELLPQIRTTPHERLFRQILDLPYLVAEDTGRPGLIVLDEFHELEHLGIHRPFHELGKRIMLERSVLYCLVSSQPGVARRILRERLNLLFGGFEIIDVDRLAADAGERLARVRLRDRRVAPHLIAFLVQLTNGHAWSLATLLETLAMRGGHGELSPQEILPHLAAELADARRPLAVWCAERLHAVEEGRAGRQYLALLQVLAGRRGTPRALAEVMHQTVSETSRQVSRLIEQGLVERHGEVYTLKSPLWSFWFRHVYLAQRAATVTTVTGITAWTRQQLNTEWQTFLATQDAPPFQRFLRLLSSFQNELVRLETRRLRLPAFARLQPEPLGPGLHQITAEPAEGPPWLYFVKEAQMGESDVTAFLQRSERLARRVGQRVVVSLDGFDASAQLLAKVSKCWVWHRPTLSALYQLFSLPPLRGGA